MDRRNSSIRQAGILVAVAAILAGAITVAWTGRANAQDVDTRKATVRVGVYNQEQVFQQYPAREELLKVYESAQADIQKAQQEGNQQRVQQLQQELQVKQQQIIQQFENDVEEALPDVAREANVHVVALEVVYTAEGVNTKDLTAEIAEGIGGEPEQVESPLSAPRR